MSAAWYAVLLYALALGVLVAGAWFVLHERRTRSSPPPAWALWLGWVVVAALVVYGAARSTRMVFRYGTHDLTTPGLPLGISGKGVLEIVVLAAVGLAVVLARRRPSLVAWAGTVARVYLAYIFLDAGWAKLGHNVATQGAIRGFQELPWQLVDGFAALLPILEIGFGVFVLVGLCTRTSAAGLALLLCVFLVAITSVWVRGINTQCGCGGGGGALGAVVGHPDYLQHLFRDGGYLLLATFLVIKRNTALTLDDPLFGERQ